MVEKIKNPRLCGDWSFADDGFKYKYGFLKYTIRSLTCKGVNMCEKIQYMLIGASILAIIHSIVRCDGISLLVNVLAAIFVYAVV